MALPCRSGVKKTLIIFLAALAALAPRAGAEPELDFEDFYLSRDMAVVNILPNTLKLNLNVGQSSEIHAEVLPDSCEKARLSFSLIGERNIAILTPHGESCTIRALSPGKTTVRIQAENGVYSTVSVNISRVPPRRIALDADSTALIPGQSTIIRASVLPEDSYDKTVTWSVVQGRENALISYGNNMLKLRAVSCGDVQVRAISADGALSSAVSVRISPSPQNVSSARRGIVLFLICGASALLLFVIICAFSGIRNEKRY